MKVFLFYVKLIEFYCVVEENYERFFGREELVRLVRQKDFLISGMDGGLNGQDIVGNEKIQKVMKIIKGRDDG